MADMMKKLSSMSLLDRMKTMHQMGSSGMLNPNAKFAKQAKSTGKRLTSEERAKIKKQKEKEFRRRKREEKKK